MSKQKLIIIVGPTASGKTSLAVSLAKIFNGEIISADSRQVYIGMDLGSGKEGRKETINLPKIGETSARIIDNVPQFLIDIISPQEIYTVADFQRQAIPLIENITHRSKTPFIVGGTNLYIQALLQGYDIPIADDKEQEIRLELEKLSPEELLIKLKSADPVSYQKIDHQNLRRIIRALSVTLSSGQPFSQQQKKSNDLYDILYLGLSIDRQQLYQNIDKRVDDRIKLGMIEEVKSLLGQGVPKERLIAFGLEYRFITQYLTGEISDKNEMIQKLKFATHAYARRQMTWLNNRMSVTWVQNANEAKTKVQSFLAKK